MKKPTQEQIDAAYDYAINTLHKTDKEFIDAAVKKWWITMDEIWNPEFGEDWMIVRTPEWTEESQNWWEKTYDDYIQTRNDEVSKLEKDMPLMDRAQIVVDWYRKLWDEKNKLTSKYDSWKSLDKESYTQKLNEINKALQEAEQSPEFKSIVDTIRENWWASFESKYLHPMINTTLEQMAIGVWSKAWNEIWESFDNWAGWDHQNSWFRRIQWSEYWLDKLPEIYDKYNWWTKDSEESKEESKWDSKYWPLKPKNPDIKKSTDEMAFWEDVAWAWGNDYLETRNNKLATALKLKWIESKEDIDKFLSQYPSWKNAKDEWKKNTLNKLSEKIGKIKKGNDKKDSEDKDNIFREDNLIKDDKWNTVWVKHIDIKKKNVWGDWTPSDDDSINWVEDDNIIRDKNWNMIWLKHVDIKKKKTAEESNEDIFNEDNLIKDKKGNTVWVKHISIKKKK